MDPADLRAAIPAATACVYCNTGASGPSPEPVIEAVTDYHRRHKLAGPCGDGIYDVAAEARQSARETIAAFIGASPAEVALTDSTTAGINDVATAMDWQPGEVVVRTDLEHPAGTLPWQLLEDRQDVEVRVVETEEGRLDLDALREAVADARLLCLSSLTWNYGTRLRVAEATAIAHDAGARVLVDAVQSPGQVPVDVTEWGADFVAASGHKWLLGPWGSGFLYVDQDALSSLSPARIGYWSVEHPTAEAYEFRAGADQFELGTKALAPFVGLEKGIELLEAVGMGTIQDHIARLTDRLKDGLGDRVVSPAAYESGLVSFEVEEPEATVERLAAEGIRIRPLPEPRVCRASIHAFNTEEDVDRLLATL